MTDGPSEKNVEQRANRLPEEHAAGPADDPEAQAQAILEESQERTDDASGTQADTPQTPGP
ncbi:hypothetical protein [Nocardioides sp. AX2bis]|uniref:hypothetical protein n=1 Tax=Nocardioides sp. AX2bis TaxID=2653157 RepID=UPI0012F10248|nr:hypothetical protein [Nocardioides sp. AX2bis]VXB68608.1 conserved hypothetical protein [Nocardioides sp. AX2bis]